MSRDLLFEIGVEELPAGYVPPALEQLERGVPHVVVRDVAERQTDFDEEAMGPAAKVAFDAEGRPTRALLGFCAGKGVDASAVRRVDTPKGEYVAVTVQH
ncbi:MAG: glycine--tRNA ligase subunit beta, partial [bacterium]